jgi:hypothetical protein
MAEFHVVIEGLDFDEDTNRQINDDIQKVVLGHLADQDLTIKGRQSGLVAFRPHPDWWGLVLRILTQGELNKVAGVKDLTGRLGP